MGRVGYRGRDYHHQQIWRLMRALTSNGWSVRIEMNPGGRCECWLMMPAVMTGGWRVFAGDTPWAALAEAVRELVVPAELYVSRMEEVRDGT